eukprot:TRINITY_DN1922_c2_g1_i1.p1 TRINITY_DN1922_c2_g1~~TRINITY_DN1922_c2_g1_i1.p1  ORF type:complete len:174 (+),score=27.72 TRINITY_DN1922_c2_g1_i1:51-572(+)
MAFVVNRAFACSFLALLGLAFVLQGCEKHDGSGDDPSPSPGPSPSGQCDHTDLKCRCTEDCTADCKGFNISNAKDAKNCGMCFTSKCSETATELCQETTKTDCKFCLAHGIECFTFRWPQCVSKCLESPLECSACWIANYTFTCLNKFQECLPKPDEKKVKTVVEASNSTYIV